MAVVKLPRMGKHEIEELIKEQMLCRIAFKGDDYPYVAPFHYVLYNGSLYFHFTDYGRKMKLLEKDNRVCVYIEKYQPDLSEYRFVALRGMLNPVTDPQERAEVIRMISQQGRERLSENFLAAHGFKTEDGWASLTSNKPLLIIKLEQITEEVGLRSP